MVTHIIMFTHYCGRFNYCWLNQSFSYRMRSIWSSNFLRNWKENSHCIFMRVGYSPPNTYTIYTASRDMQLFTQRIHDFCQGIFYVLTQDTVEI